jgi:hypothetical protein
VHATATTWSLPSNGGGAGRNWRDTLARLAQRSASQPHRTQAGAAPRGRCRISDPAPHFGWRRTSDGAAPRANRHGSGSARPVRRTARSPGRPFAGSPGRPVARSPVRRVAGSPGRRVARSPGRRVARSPRRPLAAPSARRAVRSPRRPLAAPSARRRGWLA